MGHGFCLKPCTCLPRELGIFCREGVASKADQCAIELPLTTDALCSLMGHLQNHNFMPCVMTMAAGVLCLHYEKSPDHPQRQKNLLLCSVH